MTAAITMLFWMLVGHALADYPLQGPFLSEAKNRHTAVGAQFWRWALPAHGLIHGGMVAAATGIVALGVCEAAAHMAIDFAKCEGLITLDEDQCAHVACKVVWLLLALPGA
jgi:hypothetical protein